MTSPMTDAAALAVTPRLSAAWAEQFVQREYGVSARAVPLGGYDDQNFEITCETGHRYVLKLTGDAEAARALGAQNRAMHHLVSVGVRDGIQVPCPVATLDGDEVVRVIADGRPVAARLFSFVPGVQLRDIAYLSPALLRELGSLAASLVAALGSVADAPEPFSTWDLRDAPASIAQTVPLVADERRRKLATRLAAQAQRQLAPLQASLRVGLIHCDLTDENVIAERVAYGHTRLTGVIDFADMCRSWLVAELVMLATSCLAHEPRITTIVELLRGFHQTLPLQCEEVDAVVPLIALRGVVGALETDRRAAADPDNEHLAAAVRWEWATLEVVAGLAPIAHVVLREACGFPGSPSAAAIGEMVTGRASTQTAGPVVDALDEFTPTIDLSVRSDDLRFGEWLDRAATAHAIHRRRGDGLAVGRYGEARITSTQPAGADEPATIHLGVDVFAAPGSSVRSPIAGRVHRADPAGVVLAHDGHFSHWRGIDSSVQDGAPVAPGDLLGTVSERDGTAHLPPHLHVQLCSEPFESPPGLVPSSLEAAWRVVCPDPSRLVGVAGGAPAERPEREVGRRERVIASPQVHYYSHPPEIVRGWRQWLYDSHGRGYLDMVNNVAVLGHSHPRVAEAAARQFRMLNTNSRFVYSSMTRFAEALLEVMPPSLEVVFLVSSGSEANDLALQLIREATGRAGIVSLAKAYHGWTGTPAGVSTHLQNNREGKVDAAVKTIPAPNTYRDRGNPDYVGLARAATEELHRERSGLAGFISEGFSGVSGGIPWPEGYLQEVYAVVRAAGGLCIADEVQAGYGRLGAHFWGFEQQRVVPDVVTIAKSTGNGHPVAAVATTRAIADALSARGPWFSSVGGGPVSCEVGLAVLQILREEGLQENALKVGGHMRTMLAELVGRHPICGAVHGMGLYLGLELVRDSVTLEPAVEETLAVCERMRELGVIVQPTGDYDNVVKLKPPLVVGADDAELTVERLDSVLASGWS